jgi:hypothetical protein
MKTKFVAIIIALSLITFIVLKARRSNPPTEKDFLTHCLEEIVGSLETIRYVNASDSKVFYTFRVESGSYELRYMDLTTLEEHTVPLDNPIDEIDRWSPNRRYLLIQCVGKFKEYPGHGLSQPAWLLVLDTADLSVKRLGSKRDVFEENPVWCTDETLIFSATDLSDKAGRSKRYWVDWKKGGERPTAGFQAWKEMSPLHKTDIRLMRLGDDKLAFSDDGMVFSMDLQTARIEQLSFVKEESIVPRWLNPCVDSGDILYCGTRTNLPNRNLFLLRSPRSRINLSQIGKKAATSAKSVYEAPIQLTQEHTYNGKWLEEGRGYTYIGVTNNTFLLAVRPSDAREATNLFALGHVDNLMPNPAGDKVYAVATAEPGGPTGLWEYELKTHNLRQLRSGSRIPLAHAQIARAEEFNIPSFDGLSIQGFLFTTNSPDDAAKAGTVIYLPPRTYQMRRKYDLQPELIANCGFNIVGINYRGMDGFGSSFSRRYDAELAAQDVLFVTHQLIRAGRIGDKPLYLLSQSLGSEVMKEVLVKEPGLWTAAIFQSGVPWNGFEGFKPAAMPSLFVSIGRSDPAYGFMKRFEDWATDNKIQVKSFYIENYGHYNADISKTFQQERAIAEFLIETRAKLVTTP